MQNAINKAHTWATDHGLEFSIPKTKAMIFSRRRNPPTLTVPLTMNGHDIEVVPVFEYLGVTLDSKLYWNSHIMNKTKNAKKHLMLLHRGIGSTWGTSPAITLWFYTGIVRPALTYGSAVWAKSTLAKKRIKKLNTVQRLGMLMVAPIRLKTPTTGLEIALGIPPLHLYIPNLATRTYNRLNLSPKGWPGAIGRGKTQGHIRWLETCTESLPHRELQDQCVFHKWSNLFHTFIGDGEDTTHDNGLRCYTDGSGR
jgi:hypothetical protein